MAISIHGFKVKGYRSFEDEQTFAGFRKINLFVGRNNSGKSNVLKFLMNHFGNYLLTSNGAIPDPHEHFGSNGELVISFRAGYPLEHELIQNLIAQSAPRTEAVKEVLKTSVFTSQNHIFFPVVTLKDGLVDTFSWIRDEIDRDILGKNAWQALAKDWNGVYEVQADKYDAANALVQQMLLLQTNQFKDLSKIHFISQIREIKQNVDHLQGFLDVWDGTGSIHQLASLQNPGSEKMLSSELKRHREKFNKFTSFFRQVVENPEATIQVSYDRKTILVDMDNRVSTLDKLGTGLHQLIVIALAATYNENSIFCIEELELNMHPTLQRQLVRYLVQETSNQYFITTHSAALIDANNDTAIFHIQHDGNASKVLSVLNTSARKAINDDLGFRASDLLQSNALIWVEGPSDRIYINKLLNLCSGNALKEGSHYSFVFYGGSIRAHFALENEWENFDEIENNETNEFIAMLPINRNAIMVADSDLITPNEQQKNLHKIRIAEEFKKCSSGFLWTTEGCTIENYVELEVYIRARQKVHPRSKFRAETDKFAKIAVRKKGSKEFVSIDKVAVAKVVCANEQPFNRNMDICTYGAEIVAEIRKWNGISGIWHNQLSLDTAMLPKDD